MKFLDKVLRVWRIAKARPYIPRCARLLDVGSFDGALLSLLPLLDHSSRGIDPKTQASERMITGYFPKDMPDVPPFDVITMLACLEHIPTSQLASLKDGCVRFLKPGGRLIITVPSSVVDPLLAILKALRLIDGMSLKEHHGYRVAMTEQVFCEPSFLLLRKERFQLGLNNLFVFARL